MFEHIGIVGAGTMGQIVLSAIHAWSPASSISVVDHNNEKLHEVKKNYPHVFTSEKIGESVQQFDLLILAVKPQTFLEVAQQLNGKVNGDTIVLSVMAGVSLARLEKDLGVKKIIRTMPNLCARVQKSMTVWTSTAPILSEEKQEVQTLLSHMGTALYVENEDMIDKATAVSGSGPGFFFYILEQWIDAVKKLGFSDEEAKEMLFTTLEGSLDVAKREKDLDVLVEQVASKGGTTEAGLRVLHDAGLADVFSHMLNEAYNRARELSK